MVLRTGRAIRRQENGIKNRINKARAIRGQENGIKNMINKAIQFYGT